MCTNNHIYTECDICTCDIRYGNAVLEIHRNTELHSFEEGTGQHSIATIDSEPLVTLCASCGNYLANRKALRKHLLKELETPESITYTASDCQPGTCGSCGVDLETSKERVSLVRLIAQIEWSDKLNDSELSVIDGEDVISFCVECAKKMSSHCLKKALHLLIDDIVPEGMERIEIPPNCVCGGYKFQPIYHPSSVSAVTDVDRERLLYDKKAELLRRALIEADKMDKAQG